jgi:hypothetical protein
MPNIERTSAGFQAVIPGCERRTLPKSTTSSDDTGQGLLDFYRPPALREKLAALADAALHRPVQRSGVIVAIPILAGLHHQYVRI